MIKKNPLQPSIQDRIKDLTEEIKQRDDVCPDLAYIRAWTETIEKAILRYEEMCNDYKK
jgi:hypothetical protein